MRATVFVAALALFVAAVVANSKPTTQTGLQSISGYTAPKQTATPTPTDFATGSILSPSEVPGYEQVQQIASSAVRNGASLILLSGAVAAAIALLV
ncbi:hypothetical protein MSPP1_002167 [Malassezia sp. CBS 17886]|nr:hypothetical protein MSPP1_002167 [Malassezia sp. CBS 17886]